ncbi:nuclease domain-containing protein [Chromobacterium haemolyticum]|uniref:nuclease domain-containing protein n=1 Tax=Chromobacterium TaxID=535 RepID=UPI004055D15B
MRALSKIVPRPGSTPGAGRREAGRIASQAIRNSASGEECALQIAGVCNGRTDTTVLCHLPDESHGMARKADDLSAAYGCSSCHDAIDGRAPHNWQPGEKDFYMRRGMVRTWRRLLAKGLITIKGAA